MGRIDVTVLIDNISRNDLLAEWGLSFHIGCGGKRYLLDTGGSDAFMKNAANLGVDISDVDCAVLSHAHDDHSAGMEAFFKANGKAFFHISAGAGENCYADFPFGTRYIGIPRGILSEYGDRIVRCTGVTEIADGVWTVAHSTRGLSSVGRKAGLYLRKGLFYAADDFSHEQSLVFRTSDGLAVFNSCSHSGPQVIVREVLAAFPGERVCAYVGGLHLFKLGDDDVRRLASGLVACDVGTVYTGHCTGDRGFELLREVLGDSSVQFCSGMKFSIGHE